jgi:predicted RNase H-like nuclease (RuvC/YqgF family)
MTINGWCRTNYHKDGKRRFAKLTGGLCCECIADQLAPATTESLNEPVAEPKKAIQKTAQQKKETADRRKITCLQQQIVDMEVERNHLTAEIDRLQFKLQTLINSLNQSRVEKSGIKSGVAKT